jgi:hypothetical protein
VIGSLKPRLTPIGLCCVSAVLLGLSARWWLYQAPTDYEECTEEAQSRASDQRASLITDCGVKFAGRRKSGGGYAYYDFMQNRHFDIAGPNPSPEELKQIDREYVAYLAAERQNAIAAALAKKQNEQIKANVERAQQPNVSTASVGPPLVITPKNLVEAEPKNIDRPKRTSCDDDTLACSWTKFSEKLRGAFDSTSKAKR